MTIKHSFSLQKRQMSSGSKNYLKYSVKIAEVEKCISSYREEVSISEGTTQKPQHLLDAIHRHSNVS